MNDGGNAFDERAWTEAMVRFGGMAERNDWIVDASSRGVPISDICRKAGIGPGRVKQIISAARPVFTYDNRAFVDDFRRRWNKCPRPKDDFERQVEMLWALTGWLIDALKARRIERRHAP